MLDDRSLEVLQKCKIFKGLSLDHIKMISIQGNILEFDKDDIIVEEGQVGHPLYILLEGRVEVFLPKKRKFHTQERPTRIKLNRLGIGDCVGEYSLIDEESASASVSAVDRCRVFRISRDEFRKIIESGDYLAKVIYRNMLEVLIKRSRQYSNELDICYLPDIALCLSVYLQGAQGRRLSYSAIPTAVERFRERISDVMGM